ncbi:MAG: response regulator [Deltaproteobacteria bacterium]|nr:response regulator [Deltaproteobacteria bacterium]
MGKQRVENSIRLLLVDDEERFTQTLSKRLGERGLDVATASSGSQALKLMEDNVYDVAVVDIKMPGMDGVETLREIRKISPLTEVILLTGHASVDAAIDGMRLGAFEYILKPCEIEELIAKIEEAYAKRKIREEEMKEQG